MQPVSPEAPSSRGSCLHKAHGKLLHPIQPPRSSVPVGAVKLHPKESQSGLPTWFPLESTHTRECLLWSRSWVKQTQTLKQSDSLGLQRAPVWSSLIVAGTEQGSLLPLKAGRPKVLLCGRVRPTLSGQHGLWLALRPCP